MRLAFNREPLVLGLKLLGGGAPFMVGLQGAVSVPWGKVGGG
jgi:hypothetical protein